MKFNEYLRWGVLVLVLGFLASGRYWMDQQDQAGEGSDLGSPAGERDAGQAKRAAQLHQRSGR